MLSTITCCEPITTSHLSNKIVFAVTEDEVLPCCEMKKIQINCSKLSFPISIALQKQTDDSKTLSPSKPKSKSVCNCYLLYTIYI